MEIKIIPSKDYLQVHQLRDYCFPNKYTGARRDDFHHWVEHSTTLGAYDEHKVVGQLLILPLNMTIHGENYDMGGIGFVATYPEYRQRGIVILDGNYFLRSYIIRFRNRCFLLSESNWT